jgi:hypothetical protein
VIAVPRCGKSGSIDPTDTAYSTISLAWVLGGACPLSSTMISRRTNQTAACTRTAALALSLGSVALMATALTGAGRVLAAPSATSSPSAPVDPLPVSQAPARPVLSDAPRAMAAAAPAPKGAPSLTQAVSGPEKGSTVRVLSPPAAATPPVGEPYEARPARLVGGLLFATGLLFSSGIVFARRMRTIRVSLE